MRHLAPLLCHKYSAHLLVTAVMVGYARLHTDPSVFAMTLLLATTVVAGQHMPTRLLTRDYPNREQTGGARRRRIVIVGAGVVGRTLAESLERSGRHEVLGFIDDNADLVTNSPWPVL